ncbi:hypothetical protein [Nostoc sp. 'Lobaria pulmonaria (5183) cyanobiont']|uniref:hypothetical protein n=1 Tax=Nostoc sp. 'Lobaria pulmonaria (5183) cyanobiont' TaxID=1618022 RepID=UPI000CF342F0|nr:hypothetical protein [Nostoc sp. 'Lobaria pulmonaria (5183) cyanobiont']AVH74443.1 hypothetical protein NLP_30049 [Nostoc sp. 'Lobaria pulmonaria (5183) cyanobiont']
MPIPKTIEQLQQFLETHEDFGKINGQEVVSVREDITELRNIFVLKDTYYKAVLRGTVLTYSKSQIAESALTLFLTDESIYGRQIVPKPADSGWYNTEYPALVPANTYELACSRAREIGFSESDLLTYALNLFVNNPGINQIYDAYIENLCKQNNVKADYVELKILGWLKYQARKKRLELSLAAGEFVDRAKLP